MKKLLFLLAIIIGCTNIHAQSRLSRTEIGVFGGGSYYIGDLNPYQHFNNTKFAVGGIYRRNMKNERIALRFNAFYGRVEGFDSQSDDLRFVDRNLNFQSRILELGPIVEISYLPYVVGSSSRSRNSNYGTPYLFFGLTYFKMNPMAEYDGVLIELQPLSTEGQGTSANSSKRYRLGQISLPVGLGVKFNLFGRLAMSLEYGIRKTFTDYLDDVSGTYVDLSVLSDEAGSLAAELSDRSLSGGNNAGYARGNSKTKDWYSFAGVILSFKLGKNNGCPSWGK